MGAIIGGEYKCGLEESVDIYATRLGKKVPINPSVRREHLKLFAEGVIARQIDEIPNASNIASLEGNFYGWQSRTSENRKKSLILTSGNVVQGKESLGRVDSLVLVDVTPWGGMEPAVAVNYFDKRSVSEIKVSRKYRGTFEGLMPEPAPGGSVEVKSPEEYVQRVVEAYFNDEDMHLSYRDARLREHVDRLPNLDLWMRLRQGTKK